jgi:hypothetical protein
MRLPAASRVREGMIPPAQQNSHYQSGRWAPDLPRSFLFILVYAWIAVMFSRLRSAGLVLSSRLLHLTRSIAVL